MALLALNNAAPSNCDSAAGTGRPAIRITSAVLLQARLVPACPAAARRRLLLPRPSDEGLATFPSSLATALHGRRSNGTIDADDIEHAIAIAERDRDGARPMRKPGVLRGNRCHRVAKPGRVRRTPDA